jgi:penicillin-binding protein-related factor A (putative recombinase)
VNTGKPSEATFEAFWESLGKAAFCKRVTDSAEIQGRNRHLKARVTVPKQGSDYIVTLNGRMFYAEVKSTSDPKAFRRSLITDVQLGTARRQCAAKGEYFFFVHRLPTDTWYMVPAPLILNSEKGSLSWDVDLQPFIWKPIRNARLHG